MAETVACWDCGAPLVGGGLVTCLACGASAYIDTAVRCYHCGKLLAEVASRPWQFTCRFKDCRRVNRSA